MHYKLQNVTEMKKSSFNKLELFIPVVIRVHGKNHPEMKEVGLLFEKIKQKVAKGGNDELGDEFKQLREITNHYTVPNGVCESYEAVYHMLAESDEGHMKMNDHIKQHKT